MNILKMRILIINIILFVNTFLMLGQNSCDTLPLIQCDENLIHNIQEENLRPLIDKFQNIKSEKHEPIRIVHIGDSHLQAGFITEKIKQELFQRFSQDTIASPGFVFPYTIAQTNNPFFYNLNYKGDWDWCKNVDFEKTCRLGLSGITVRTKDSLSSIQLKMENEKYNDPINYYFNRIRILHSSNPISIKVNGIEANTQDGTSVIQLNNITDSISVEIKNPLKGEFFELYGIILENEASKINYHTIGVNGATAQSYLKCDYFSRHLMTIDPDLVILSLGTNEAFNKDFNPIEHEYVLKDLILQIKDVTPDTDIILTIPNDHFKNGKSNINVESVRENIIKIAKEFNLSYWDFYTIMGSQASMEKWHEKGLTGDDKIHFKKKGYAIQGELFARALINLIDNF